MNEQEAAFKSSMERNGYTVLHKGWPDFLVRPKHSGSAGFTIELKRGKDKLSEDQKVMHEALASMGVRVYTAREEEWKQFVNKRGRYFDPTASVENLQSELHKVDSLRRELGRAVKVLEARLQESTILFDPTQTATPADFEDHAVSNSVLDAYFGMIPDRLR